MAMIFPKVQQASKKKRLTAWFWVGMQLLQGAIYVTISLVHKGHLPRYVFLFQWATIWGLLYIQLRCAHLRGYEITVRRGRYRKREHLPTWGLPFPEIAEIVYKIRPEGEAYDMVTIWPVIRSRRRLVNLFNVWMTKLFVWIKVIK